MNAKILVVDDNEMDRQFAANLLTKQMGATVLTASDGQQAMELIHAELPSLVLTDLQMPHLDGLALVQEIRRHHANIPTVLMTAYGSEEVAFTALQHGAASYVAKKKLALRLTDTVRNVLALSRASGDQKPLRSNWLRSAFEFSLENDASTIPSLVNHLQQYAASIRPIDETEQIRVAIALHEALRNAMHHGNLELSSELRQQGDDTYYEEAARRRTQEPYANRRVYFRAEETAHESRYLVRDEGEGFDVTAMESDPTELVNLESPSGRGLFLIRTFMDEVVFNERGNEVVLIHRKSTVY
jgi:CheY-like chemotaxis protein